MLAKANRITTAADYRRLTRTGRRQQQAHLLAYGRRVEGGPLRLGVIVTKKVGGAVVRNRVRRRIKAVGWALAQERSGLELVIRALPSAATACWSDLEGDVRAAVDALSVAPTGRARARSTTAAG